MISSFQLSSRPASGLLVLLAICWAPFWLVTPSSAADGGDPGSLDGEFRLGYRFVDIGGSENKYAEDFNLDEGVRLFEFRLDFEAPENLRGVADRISLDIDSFGGDPFQSLHLRMQRFGSYDFRYDRRESTYFYNDVILPIDLSTPSLSNAGDFHTFDFDRIRDTANLTIHLAPRAKLDVGFERFSRSGDSTTVYDVSRDEFELDQPFDESYDELRIGFQYSWPKVTLVLEERIRDFETEVDAFLPGASLGEDPADATTLDFYRFDRPYTLDSSHHLVRLNAKPTDRLRITGAALFFDFELEAEADEVVRGTAFNGQPLDTVTVGRAEIEQEGELFDIDFSYLLSDRWAVVGGVRQHSFDQEGRGDFGSDEPVGAWHVETTALELGFETTLAPGMTLSLGVLSESRDVEHAADTDGTLGELEETSTDHDGFFGRIGWTADNGLRLQLSVEDSSFDDPFTLASPTDRRTYRLSARYQSENGFFVNGSFQSYDFENGNSGWDATRDQLTARFGWRSQRLDVALGYSMIEADRDIDQLVTTLPGFGGGQQFLFPVLYRSDADFLDAHLRWRAQGNVSLGADIRTYENDGSFGLERDDFRAFVELGIFERYLLNLAFRTVDYEEQANSFDDYDAEIIEVSVGYQF